MYQLVVDKDFYLQWWNQNNIVCIAANIQYSM